MRQKGVCRRYKELIYAITIITFRELSMQIDEINITVSEGEINAEVD